MSSEAPNITPVSEPLTQLAKVLAACAVEAYLEECELMLLDTPATAMDRGPRRDVS